MKSKEVLLPCEEDFLSKLSKEWRLEKLLRILEGAGELSVPEGHGFAEIRFLKNRPGSGTLKRLQSVVTQLEECSMALDYMKSVNENFSAGRFREYWLKDYAVPEDFLQNILMENQRLASLHVRDYLVAPSEHFFNMFNCIQCSATLSSDFWREDKANRIDVSYLSFDGCLHMGGSAYRLARLLPYLAASQTPREDFPRLYDFVCGRPVEQSLKLRFSLVAKYHEADEGSLLTLARHYVDKYLAFDQTDVEVDTDWNTLEISKVKTKTVDKSEFEQLHGKYNFFTDNLYAPEDLEYIYDEAIHADVPVLKLLEFTCTFNNVLKLRNPVKPSSSLDRYVNGVSAESEFREALCQAVDLFEHPGEFKAYGVWLIHKPTQESLQELLLRKQEARDWNVVETAHEIYKYGDESVRKILRPLQGSLNNHGDLFYGDVSMGWLEAGMGGRGEEKRLEESAKVTEAWAKALSILIKLWPEISTPKRLLKKIGGRVRLDPLRYVDASEPLLSGLARNLMI